MASRTALIRALRSTSSLLPSSGKAARTVSGAATVACNRSMLLFSLRLPTDRNHYQLQQQLKMSTKTPPPTEEEEEEEVPVLGVGKWKTSTGLVGLAVDHNWFENMTTKYQALLDKMAASDMPETAYYRECVEKIARYRIKAAMDHPDDPDMVEELCNCGQVEELVQQADDEMIVLDMYLRERMWEIVEEYNKDREFIVEVNPDHMNEHDTYDWQKEEAFGDKYTKMKEEAEYRASKAH